MKYKLLGDSAVIIYPYTKAEDDVDNRDMRRFYRILQKKRGPGIEDVVLCRDSIGIYFSPEQLSPEQVINSVLDMIGTADSPVEEKPQTVTIPVRYGGMEGPDLEEAAQRLGLHPDELISEHAENEYTVWGMGFMPGFPYMGRLPARLVLPRKPRPAACVAAGSVAIAGWQTGIYPFESPGGWHIIGRTTVSIFDINRPRPSILEPGDKVRFVREKA